MVDSPEPIAVWLAPGNLCGDIPVLKLRRSECDVTTAQRWGLSARAKLRVVSQKIDKEFSNLIEADHYFAVTTSQCGIRFIKRDKPFNVTSIGALYEKSLEIIWYFRWFVHERACDDPPCGLTSKLTCLPAYGAVVADARTVT